MENKFTPGPMSICGFEVFDPEEGDIRIKSGEVIYWIPDDPRADDFGNVSVIGLMVQEYGPRYSDDGLELTGAGIWRDLCPLVDFPMLYSRRENQLPNLRTIAKTTGQ